MVVSLAGALVGVVVLGWLVLRASGRQQARIDASRTRAVPATARIVAVAGNGSSLRTTAGVAGGHDLTLDVAVADRDPYRVTLPFSVWPMAIPVVQVGQELAVHVDLHDERLVYPDNTDIEPDTHSVVRALKGA